MKGFDACARRAPLAVLLWLCWAAFSAQAQGLDPVKPPEPPPPPLAEGPSPNGIVPVNYSFGAAPVGASIPPSGTLVPGSAADDVVVTTAAPFAFSIYGTPVSAGQTLTVSTNGNLQFVAAGGSTSLTNVQLPATIFPNAPVVFGYWDDLILTTPGGGIYTNTVGSAPNRSFVIEWRGRRFGDGSTTQNINFAVLFAEGSSSFCMLYAQTGIGVALDGVSASVGVQAGNTAQSAFTQHSLNQSVITPGLRLAATLPGGGALPQPCGAFDIAPTVDYAPAAANEVAFTGVTTPGSTGTGRIVVTPSGGSGSGADATTTIGACSVAGPDAASFAGAGTVALAFVGGATTAQNIDLTCTAGTAARTASLTCSETRGSGAPVARSWPLSCPLGIAPPQFGYVPAPGATVTATGGTGINTTGTLTITPSIATPGSGSGAAATTTLTCTPPAAPFAGFGQTVTAIGDGAIGGGPLSGTCTLGVTAATQTLTCNESRAGSAVARTFNLACPAGALQPVTTSVPSGSSLALAPTGPGLAPTEAVLSFGNPNPVAVAVTCTAPAAPFSASPLTINVPANGAATTTVRFAPPVAGTFNATLACTSAATGQALTFPLTGTASAVSVDALGTMGRWMLGLLLLGFGLVAIRLVPR